MAMAPVFLISLLLHTLVGWRLAADLASTAPWLATALWVWLAASAALMPMGVLAPRFARPPLDKWLTWAGLLCMGLFSSTFVLTLLRDLMVGILTLAQAVLPAPLPMESLRTQSALMLPVAALVITLLGFWNARRTAQVVRVDVPIANLPDALVGFSMAQISDIHVGPTIKARYLQRIVDRVNLLDADLVAITGDLVDGSVNELGHQVAPLAQLTSTYGSFFVTGNHEYYSGAQHWIAKLRSLGIQVLMNEHVVIDHRLDSQDVEAAKVVVAGVTDYSAHHFDENHRSDPHAALANAPEQAFFKLLLAHQPRSAAAAAAAGFDLQLSGHTHGGQFWPWGYFVRFQQPFTAGMHRLHRLWVYTSRGTGYWGPPKRFGAPSEITFLRLVKA